MLRSLDVQVSPPRRISPVPGAGEVEAHVFVQLGIPGMCAQGEASVVPELESDPVDLEI